MATFISGYISDLSPVKDNIQLRVRILRAWLQPLYNNQQIKNMKMIVMDKHNTKMQVTVRMDKLKRFQHHLKEVHGFVWRPFQSITDLEKEEDGQFDVVGQVIACADLENYDKNRKAGKTQSHSLMMSTKLYLFDGNKAIYKDEYKEVEEFRQRLFANQPFDQLEHTATKISTASKNSTKDTFVNKHPIRNIVELLDGVQSVIVGTMIAIQEDEGWWYLGCRACRGKDETETMSLSLFNDEVQAMVGRSAYQLCEKYAKSESDGSIPTEITNLIGNKYAFKVATDDYNVKKLLPVFIVLRFSNDQEIINSVLACAIPIKDLESQTNENTTPNEKQKTNKCHAEGEPGSESSTGKKKAVEINVEKDA
nr:hypothetical protein [Tanacetum cinerariifolium]